MSGLAARRGQSAASGEVGEQVHEVDLADGEDLQEADARLVAEQVVGLGIERDFGAAIERGEERGELLGPGDELVVGDGVQGIQSFQAVRKASISCGRSGL